MNLLAVYGNNWQTGCYEAVRSSLDVILSTDEGAMKSEEYLVFKFDALREIKFGWNTEWNDDPKQSHYFGTEIRDVSIVKTNGSMVKIDKSRYVESDAAGKTVLEYKLSYFSIAYQKSGYENVAAFAGSPEETDHRKGTLTISPVTVDRIAFMGAPVAEKPAPVAEKPAPVAEKPAPAQVAEITTRDGKTARAVNLKAEYGKEYSNGSYVTKRPSLEVILSTDEGGMKSEEFHTFNFNTLREVKFAWESEWETGDLPSYKRTISSRILAGVSIARTDGSMVKIDKSRYVESDAAGKTVLEYKLSYFSIAYQKSGYENVEAFIGTPEASDHRNGELRVSSELMDRIAFKVAER